MKTSEQRTQDILERAERQKAVRAKRMGAFGCEALVRDRREARRKYPDAVIDAATLDDIMLFYVKGEKI